MADFPFDIVLFDLDGTLVDSNLDLAPAINHALALEDRGPVSLSTARTFIGGGTVQMMRRALAGTGEPVSDDRFEQLLDAMLKYYWAHIADHTVPYDGVLTALDQLAGFGCKLAVCTNKLEKPARQLIQALGMTSRFSAIYGGDTLGHDRAKPEPDMLQAAIADCGGGRAVMIGDSTFDVRAARAAGLPVIAYAPGYNDVPVEQLGADMLIDHFDQLVPALQKQNVNR